MAKFLSNDRKVIFFSAITGTLLISTLSRVLFIDNMFIWFLGGVGFLAIYWSVPTWFSHNRQLIKDNGKFFNAEGEEVTNKSSRERLICILLFFAINAFLILFAYDLTFKKLLEYYPNYTDLIIDAAVIIYLTTPYLLRHLYCFIKNAPMNTSLKLNPKISNSIYAPKSHSNSISFDHFTNAKYSYLPYNVNHRKN